MTRSPVRPVDAAGLVLVRGTGERAEVLMGRRHRASRFMPDVYVFPGGRVEPSDVRPSGFPEPLAPAPGGLDRATRRRLAVFARTALRETFEETGVLIAGATSTSSTATTPSRHSEPAAVWQAYDRAGLAPAFGDLTLVARALTPTSSPIRFHTRFFRGDGGAARGALRGDGELEDLHWVPVGAVSGLPLSEITLLILREALAHEPRAAGRPAAFFRWVGDRRRIT